MLDSLKKKISTHVNGIFHDGDVEVTIYPRLWISSDQ